MSGAPVDAAVPNPRLARRVRHELRFRILEVRRVTRVTPRMLRVTLGGEDLAGFTSASFDDHVKLFFPAPGEDAPPRAVPGPNGTTFPEGVARPPARDYTPRRYDPAAGELEIDFALHEHGPATEWAIQARPGQKLGVGGPRGSFILPDELDWLLLIGDETALPAIGRRLEELPATTRAVVLAEVADPAEQQPFRTQAPLDLQWLHRNGAAPGRPERLEAALSALTLPPGEGYAWVGCESAVAKRLRTILVDGHGLPKERIRASGYWKHGADASHETHND
ncbi:siderophore-interacting protein [Roseomonas sp. BN140053]|uniref:siderophore-interacting protein n=1 Tax=Roseomonas sp. BN140053 TaxID=3391898 RepID=UPI0039E81D2C